MATVTKQFKADFETWAQDRIDSCAFTPEEMDEVRDMLRIELKPGPDQFRVGVEVLNEAGVKVPATIDDHEERYKLWADYFASEAAAIRRLERKAA